MACVGVMPLPEKDLIYYFIAGGGFKDYRPLIRKDYIIEYDTISKTSKYVFVDIHSVRAEASQGISFAGILYFIISDNGETTNKTGIRKGMHITGEFTDPALGTTITLTVADNVLVTDIVKTANGWEIHHDYGWESGGTFIGISQNDIITYSTERVLKFNPLVKINSINHLGGMLFWTDGDTEQGDFHASFKLSALGEEIGIYDSHDSYYAVIDFVVFGQQQSDISIGRIPDGTGTVAVLPYATPGYSNTTPLDLSSISENDLNVFPNPYNDILNITFSNDLNKNIIVRITDITGRIVSEHYFDNPGRQIRLSSNNLRTISGVYVLTVYAENDFGSVQLFGNKLIVQD